MRIHQWVPAAHRGDAIGDSARKVREMLRSMGHDSEIFAMTIDEDLRGDVLPFSDPAARTGDVTIFHFALPSPMSQAFASLPHGRVLQYHNVTPAHFFAPYDPALFRLIGGTGVLDPGKYPYPTGGGPGPTPDDPQPTFEVVNPTSTPTADPTADPTGKPSDQPTSKPTPTVTETATPVPSAKPTPAATATPTGASPTTAAPTPSAAPTDVPSSAPPGTPSI